MRALLVSAEGKDGVGKTTQLKRLAEARRRLGERIEYVKFPSSGIVGKLARRMLSNGSAPRWPNLFQLLQWVDRAAFQAISLGKLLRDNDVVLLDRWHGSVVAYGHASGAVPELVEPLSEALREPDLVLLFQGTEKPRGDLDSYESDVRMQSSVDARYDEWARTSNANVFCLNADGTVEEVALAVSEVVEEAMEEQRDEVQVD